MLKHLSTQQGLEFQECQDDHTQPVATAKSQATASSTKTNQESIRESSK